MGGKEDEGRVLRAVGYESNDYDPTWQTAKALTPKLIPVPNYEAPPAILPTPIPTAPQAIAVILQIPDVDTMPRLSAAPLPSPVSIPQQTWQPIPTQTQPVAAQLAAAQSVPTSQPVMQSVWRQPTTQMATTGRPATKPQPQMSSGELASPPPNASAPQLIAINASRQVLELERQIRTASIRSATILEVNEAGPQKLVVKYVSKTEASAREAAQAISELPSLRTYAVDFEVRLAGR